MTYEQEVIRSVFDAYIGDIKSVSDKDRPTVNMLEEVKNKAIKALEQQPSEDEITITMKKGTLKYSGYGYVVYNKDWFRKHFATEVKIMTGYDGYIEQQPCEDCVSREQAVKAITDWYIDMLENGEGKDPINVLDSLPPATPTHSWIPVSEKLPESEGLYLVSVKNDRLRQYSKTCWFNSHLNWFSRQDVIAWQPLPKPYEGEKDEEMF